MADLSGVLRKTIDGLPRATPQMRAKVYEKARAAIQRQIDAANPPLEAHVVDARLAALEDAIERTEADYAGREGEAQPAPSPAAVAPPPPPGPGPEHRPEPPSMPPPVEPAAPHLPAAEGPSNAHYAPPEAAPFREGGSPHLSAAEPMAPPEGERKPFFPMESEATEDERRRPAEVGAPFIVPSSDGHGAGESEWSGTLPAGIRSADIPEADLSAPRRRQAGSGAGKRLVVAALVLVALGGLGTAGWLYRADIERLLVEPSGLDLLAEGEEEGQAPGAGDEASAPSGTPDGVLAPGEDPTRQFTQRLLPDGGEVDEGPAERVDNAFEEGTDVSAASPMDESQPGASPTLESDLNEIAPDSAAPEAAETPEDTVADAAGIPQVAQDAVFYQERTESAPGTQEAGEVVWSLVEEPPAEGQPPEPAIRAQAAVPDENLTLTMTIRRNADPTLPASHVIELLFETPDDFSGGSIATVQRLTLKGTEQARGEPLIGVAGRISDGFFILALNNLDQAVQNNLNLLRGQNWIDIPIAYESGRRALLSIEKGQPGAQAFNQAIEAWQSRS